MSLAGLLNSTVSVQRKSTTKDSSGGQVEGFATVAGLVDLPANVQGNHGKAFRALGQRQIFVSHNIYFDTAYDIRRGDRLYESSTGRYYVCVSIQEDMGGQGRAFRVECSLES